MQGYWSKLDDRRGAAWRAKMVARRLQPRRMCRFAWGLARNPRHVRPVFIVGVPRSGTSSLVRLLRESEELRAPPWESHGVWLAFHHPRRSNWSSGAIGPGQLRTGERRFVSAYFYSYCGTDRILDKAPASSLRIPHLREVFPDAVIVAMHRDPCDVVSALIKGWRQPDGRFRSYYVPEDLRIPGYPHQRQWRFALIPGWRDCIGQPIREVAFMQWDRIAGAIESSRALVPESSWIDVHLEELRQQPEATLARLCEGLGIAATDAMAERLRELNVNPAGASSRPAVSKWRQENPNEIRGLLPRIAAASAGRGYRIDAASGDFEIGPSSRPTGVESGPPPRAPVA